jgi:hypothetical protein
MNGALSNTYGKKAEEFALSASALACLWPI